MSRLGRSLGPGKLFLQRRGRQPRWYLDWKDGTGRRRREALSSDKRVAERLRAELISQRDKEMAGLGAVEGQSRPLKEIKDLYLADLAQRATPKTVENVSRQLKHLLGSLRATRVRDLQVVELMRYRIERIQTGSGHRTVNCTVGALRAMLNWAANACLIAENPIRNLKPLPYREEHKRRIRRALSDEEIVRLLEAAEEDDAEQAAHCAAETTIAHGTKSKEYAERRRSPRVGQAILWRTLLETGARWSELTSTTWADLDCERLTLRLRATTTKSRKMRLIPLRRELAVALWGLRDVHQRARQRMVQPTDPIFLSPEGADMATDTAGALRIFYRVLDRAGIAKRTSEGVIDIHALRHTAASRMARNGVPLLVTQRVLGHSDPSLTARVYTHLDVEDLRQAVIEMPAGRSSRIA